MSKKILIAKVTKPFGIKGEVKVVSFCEDPFELTNYPLIDKDDKKVNLKFTNKSIFGSASNGKILAAKINNISNRNDAEKIRDLEIFTFRENFNNESDGEYYVTDLIGLDVIENESKEKIGNVTNILDFGAGTIIEIKFTKEKIKEGYQQIETIPFKDEFFPEVEILNNKIFVNLPEFLLTEKK